MLFWLFVIILIIGITIIVIGNINWDSDKHYFLWLHDDEIKFIGGIISFISGIALGIFILIILGNYSGIDAKLEEKRETYNALVYKVESGACRDDFGLLNKEVIDEIQDWNTKVVYLQNIQDDFWAGIFYPNVYDEFEKIDYNKYSKEELQ